jgi:hypothetical protein
MRLQHHFEQHYKNFYKQRQLQLAAFFTKSGPKGVKYFSL